MKKILMYSLLCLVTFSLGAQDEYVEDYNKVMHKFLSNTCMSFDMSAIQYGDLDGKEIVEQLDLKVIRKNDVWYLQTGEFEMIYTKDIMVTIDNQSQQVKSEKLLGVSPEAIFANPLGTEKVLDFLQLIGNRKVLTNGNTVLGFTASGENKTSIELEFNPMNSMVYRSTANIDMTYYDDIDHPMDGMRVESIYRNANINECRFDEKTEAIVKANFSGFENQPAFQNYKLNQSK